MIGSPLAAALRKLRPNGAELQHLVAMEMDTSAYRRFEQLTPGPVLAALALVAIAAYGALCAPFRLLRR